MDNKCISCDREGTDEHELIEFFMFFSPFDDEDEVIARANDTPYGLACSIWTENLGRAHRVAPRIDVGILWVNSWFLRDLRTPFGGAKQSGIGREGGAYSFEFYTEISNICIKL